MRFKNSFHPYAITTILVWSMAFVFTRMALPFFSASGLACLRFLVASAALAGICAIKRIAPPSKKDWVWVSLSGASGFFLYTLLFNIGSATGTSATNSVIIATAPVMTALLARIIYKETLRPIQWVAIGIEFVGILVLTLWNGVLAVNTGALYMFAAALLLSAYNILQRKLVKTYTSLQSTAYSIFAGTAMLCIFAPTALREAAAAPAHALVFAAVLGLFCSALGFVSWSAAFRKAARTSLVSNYMFVTPLLATALGFLLAGEAPDAATVAGAAIILPGILLFNLEPRKKEEPACENASKQLQ